MFGSRSGVDVIVGGTLKEFSMSKNSAGRREPPAGGSPEPGGIEEDALKLETKGTKNTKMHPEALEESKPHDFAENTAPGMKDDKPASGNTPNSSQSGSSSKSSGGSKSFWGGCSALKFFLVAVVFVFIAFLALWVSEDKNFTPIREGVFSTVYLAWMTKYWQLCAVKAIEIGDRTTEENAKQEAAYMKELQHENVVGYYDYWKETVQKQSTFYIAMEYCGGGTLRAALSKWTPDKVTRIETGLTKGLEYIHEKGIAHRDIKSDNILMDSSGTPKYADFGLAKRLNATTKKTDMNGLKTILGEVQRHLTNANREVNTLTRMTELIEPNIANTLSSVSQLSHTHTHILTYNI